MYTTAVKQCLMERPDVWFKHEFVRVKHGCAVPSWNLWHVPGGTTLYTPHSKRKRSSQWSHQYISFKGLGTTGATPGKYLSHFKTVYHCTDSGIHFIIVTGLCSGCFHTSQSARLSCNIVFHFQPQQFAFTALCQTNQTNHTFHQTNWSLIKAD